MSIFKHEDTDKKLQKALERMEKDDASLAKEIDKELYKRDDKERDYLIDERTDTEWTLYEHDYSPEFAASSMENRLEKDSLEEEKTIENIAHDIDERINKSEKRYEKHQRK